MGRPGRASAFVSAGVFYRSGAPLVRTGTCRVRMVATNDIGSSTDGVRSMGPAGAVQSYMSKIPAHLQGLAIRKQDKRETDWMTAKEDQDKDLAAIQAELDADDDEEDIDQVDYAMQLIDELDKDREAITMRTYDLDIKDAELLKQLKNSMHAEDFRRVFGRGVGDLL